MELTPENEETLQKAESDAKLFETLADIQRAQENAEKNLKQNAEQWWSSLDEPTKLLAFYCVTKRMHKGDIVEKRSYRGVLYDTFDFGLESYTVGIVSGYLDIHNAIAYGQLCDELRDQENESNKSE